MTDLFDILDVLGDDADIKLDREMVSRVGGYYEFIKKAWHTVESRPFVEEPYVKFLADHMEALMLGRLESGRLLINIPPGHSKSLVMVVFSLPYLWTLDPTAYTIYAHKSIDIGRDMARKTRQVVNSSWYQSRWDVAVLDDAKKVDRFSNNKGGGRVTVTVRQMITGSHAKGVYGGLIVLDDPDRPDDSISATEEVAKWYREVLPTRFADLSRSQICIVQQRISQRDLSSTVLDSGEFYDHVCLPMHYDPARHCSTPVGEDWRTEKGQLLSPLRNTEATIERLREVFDDPRIADAQLEQKPTADDGNIFLVDWFETRYDILPRSVQFTISCDLTFSGAKTSDYAVLQVWARGLADGKHYMVDQVRRKMGFVDTAHAIIKLAEQYTRPNLLIEKTANGFAVIDILTKAGVERIEEFKVGRNSKEQRASTVSYLFDRGDVLFPRIEKPWFPEFVREMTGFPALRHDDSVDACANYLAWATGSTPLDLANAFRFAGKLSQGMT